MKNIMWFSEIRKANLAEVGGKGANLGEMAANGFPVPAGFVVTSGAYFLFINHNHIGTVIKEMTSDLDIENTDALAKASEMIKSRIMGGEIPLSLRSEIMNAYRSMIRDGREPFVAVRSSATAEDLPEASFAGQQSTFLNVKGAENVVQATKECWASLFEPRSIYYRTENKFDHLKVGLAAVIQQMVQSEKAGVMFSVDPMSQDWNDIDIEAAYGLGEIVVSGETTPDRYIVDKNSLQIKTKTVAKQTWMITKINEKNVNVNVREEMQERQKLTDQQIVELAKIGVRIEQHYGKPQDLEWAVAEGKLFIVQTRPITTLRQIKGQPSSAVSGIPMIGEKPPEVKTQQQALASIPQIAKPTQSSAIAAVKPAAIQAYPQPAARQPYQQPQQQQKQRNIHSKSNSRRSSKWGRNSSLSSSKGKHHRSSISRSSRNIHSLQRNSSNPNEVERWLLTLQTQK